MAIAPEPSDEALFADDRAGDAAAFEALFRRWQEPLGRHLARMVDDPAAADDLVMETFLRLHRHRGRWREGTPLRPWLFCRLTGARGSACSCADTGLQAGKHPPPCLMKDRPHQ
jgi:DNA-directed RNA polymerase specialized sigma24 family protein